MKKSELIRRLKFIESVLEGVVPSGRHSGKRRQRQHERIDEAIVSTQELREYVAFMADELSGERDLFCARMKADRR